MEHLARSLNYFHILSNSPDLASKLTDVSVALRDPSSRSDPSFANHIPTLLSSLKRLSNQGDPEVIIAILKILVNGVAYNDTNRKLVSSSTDFAQASKDLVSGKDSDLYENLVIVLLENITCGNEDDDQDASKVINEIFSNFAANGWVQLVLQYSLDKLRRWATNTPQDLSELYSSPQVFDFQEKLLTVSGLSINEVSNVEVHPHDLDHVLGLLEKLLIHVKSLQDPEEFEELTAFVGGLTNHLATISPKLQLSKAPQKRIFGIFELLEEIETLRSPLDKNTRDTLKQISRRMFAVLGDLSSNVSYDNHQDVDLALEELKRSSNGYVLSLCMLILTNSMDSKADRDTLLTKEPHLINHIFKAIVPKTEVGFDQYVRLADLHLTGLTELEKQLAEKYRSVITFFTEPLLCQSLFHLLRLLLIPDKLDSGAEYFVEELKQNLHYLNSLILLCFNSMFFVRINMTLLTRFLNTLFRNFANYDSPSWYGWYVENSRPVIVSMANSVQNVSEAGIVKIKELNGAARLEVVDVLQTLFNALITNNVDVSREMLSRLLKAIFDNKPVEENVSVSFQSDNEKKKVEMSDSQLSKNFITLTIMAHSIEKDYILEFFQKLENLEKIVLLVETALERTLDVKEDAPDMSQMSLLGLRNNLKVFIVKMNSLLKQRPEIPEKYKYQFDEYLGSLRLRG